MLLLMGIVEYAPPNEASDLFIEILDELRSVWPVKCFGL